MTQGGSGMQFGDDYVAARLSVEVPEGSAASIRELTDAIERFHVTMEAAVRAEADGTRYLDQMAESTRRATEAATAYNQQLQMTLSLEARGGGQGSSGVPAGAAIPPFQASEPGHGGPRPPSPSDVPYQLGTAASGQARDQSMLNMQESRGRLSNADLTSLTSESISELASKIAQREQAAREQENKTDGNSTGKAAPAGQGPGDEGGISGRIARTAGLAGQVMSEMGPGGSTMGLGSLAARGIAAAARRRSSQAPGRGTPSGGEAEGPAVSEEGTPGTGTNVDADANAGKTGLAGAMGGLTKVLGPLGAALTGAMAVFGLVEKGGSMVQGMRNVASVRGGAAGEGAQVEAKARILSMNPFITQDQARQVYQSVMSEGYADASGSGADNVIDFMTHNLTSMNIQVADSAKMLRSTIAGNTKGDDASVAGAVNMLGKELDQIRTLSRGGKLSTPDFRSGVMALQSQFTDLGATPQAAGQQAMLAEEIGSGDQNLKGQFGAAMGDLGSSQQGQMLMRTFGGAQVPGNLMPDMTEQYLLDTGQAVSATNNTLKHFAMQAKQMDRGDKITHMNAIGFFYRMAKRFFPSTKAGQSVAGARAMYEELTGSTDWVQQAQAQGGGDLSLPSSGGEENPFSGGGGGGAPSQAPIPTPSGGSGGGGGTEQYATPSGGGGGGGGVQRTEVSGAVQIGLTPDAQRLLQVVGGNSAQLTPNQIATNRGVAGHSLNSPPPG